MEMEGVKHLNGKIDRNKKFYDTKGQRSRDNK